ncbi:heme o synthase [Ferviditalea candida]|uniref:Protoheme IX farnesyltransferase n=1 Tax=Ferviditalea candida TaxID=3108399 RepID=A0ABU5ZIE7_9BACL|nr:heme o synthase [Paenibacillaceae bacterium T2]
MSLAKMPLEKIAGSHWLPLSKAVQTVNGYAALTKPRIMFLLLFTQYCAMIVAAGGLPTLHATLFGLLGLALSTGGAAAMNMWYDRDIDAVMTRTAQRPIPSGRIRARNAFWFGIALLILSIWVLGVFVNPLTALLSFAGFIYYVVVYTVWLKRRTPQNIVIGGGAGAFPPLVGWAAVTGHLGWTPWIMFLIVFLWTPPHFWALALYKQGDYQRAGIPMMPVVAGERSTKRQSLVYTGLLAAISISLYFTGRVGIDYLIAAVLLNGIFTVMEVMLLKNQGSDEWARRVFKYSILYLPILFIFMVMNVHH